MVRCRMLGSAENARRQSASLITATGYLSGTVSSSAVNVRPTAGCAPSSGKYEAETSSASTRDASGPDRMFSENSL